MDARPRSPRPLGALFLALGFVGTATSGIRPGFGAEDPFAANVRPTEPLTPEAQVRTLQVPEGFAVQLVAAEPDLHKPMNLAFDAVGRLWVTTSREYPRPVAAGQPGRDRVMVFEDFGPDGRARKVTPFAEGLNIPIGVYPYRSAGANGRETWKAVVWSIPNIWVMEDTDGDGRADRREKLYGPFDHTRDTHGNQASFRRGFDGLLYATHGFNNDSHVAGLDGNRVDLNSGNTYAIRLDGSRIEQHTWGQVNPFGLAWDPRGNLWSSDCHSEPIYLLQRGGYYPSFGKPHDGLGFAPNTMEAIRGSTAIDAITYYADDLWPADYRDCVLVGDVMTSRVYRDFAEVRGSGRVARARPDFVVSADPWFRPVDTTLGPDGALYIADFYNRIIGHYEVPLDHPGRDRERGRIFRVIPTGKPLRAPALAQDVEGQVAELGSPSLARRMLAMNELADRQGARLVGRLREVVARPANGFQRVHALWLLRRLQSLSPAELAEAVRDGDPLVRVHAMRIVADQLAEPGRGGKPAAEQLATALAHARNGLNDPDPEVGRVAAEALGNHPDSASLEPLLALRARIEGGRDPHLLYGVRKAIRDVLQDGGVGGAALARNDWNARDARSLLDVLVAVKTEAAGSFLLRQRARYAADPEFTRLALAHAARYAPVSDIDALVDAVGQAPGDLDFQVGLYRSIQQGLARRGAGPGNAVRAWAGRLARELLDSCAAGAGWSHRPVEGLPASADPWDFEERVCADGRRVRLMSSFPRGERLTGALVSRPFAAPPRVSFFLAGHDGLPDQPAGRRNRVRLREAASGGAVLFEAFAPRNDTAQRVDWDLGTKAGTQVVLEAIDGDAGASYAWLAFGRVESAGVPALAVAPATITQRQTAAAELVQGAGLSGLVGRMAELARDRGADPAVRAAAARAMDPDPVQKLAAELVGDATQPAEWRARTADTLFEEGRPGAEDLIADVWKNAPQRFQVAFAALATATPRLAAELFGRLADGRAPVALLLDRRLRERLGQSVGAGDRATLERLVRSLPEEDPAVLKLLEQRRSGFRGAVADAARGKEIFTAGCAACHQVNGEGGLVGPQLTGIGTRGAERLCEDILVPNRNVDHAFWTTVLTLKDGETVSGLFRREEGALLVLANAAGAEFTVPKAEVAGRRESQVSVMPSNFGEALTESDFYHLLAYLLSQSGK